MRFLSGLMGRCLLLGAGVIAADANPIIWTITPLNFSPSGTVSGVFTYDADTNLYSAWSIDLSDFEDPVVNGLVTPSTSVISSFSSSTEFNFSYSAGQAEFNLGFATFDPGFTGVPLTDAGGSVPGFAGVIDIPNFTSWNTGLLPSVASTAPEPMSAVLVLISGFGLFACCKWCFRTWAAKPIRSVTCKVLGS